VEQQESHSGSIAVTGPGDWSTALGGSGRVAIAREDQHWTARVPTPGALFLLKAEPSALSVPADLVRWPRVVVTVSDSGLELVRPPVAGVSPAEVTIGGVKRAGLRAHPPDHGRTIAYLPMQIPKQPVTFRAFAGIAGTQSKGVVFIVEVNGQELIRRRMLPGQWEELSVSLARWAGQSVVVGLATDSDGPFSFDWAHWGEPRVVGNR
jgi:hypothetical protein